MNRKCVNTTARLLVVLVVVATVAVSLADAAASWLRPSTVAGTMARQADDKARILLWMDAFELEGTSIKWAAGGDVVSDQDATLRRHRHRQLEDEGQQNGQQNGQGQNDDRVNQDGQGNDDAGGGVGDDQVAGGEVSDDEMNGGGASTTNSTGTSPSEMWSNFDNSTNGYGLWIAIGAGSLLVLFVAYCCCCNRKVKKVDKYKLQPLIQKRKPVIIDAPEID